MIWFASLPVAIALAAPPEGEGIVRAILAERWKVPEAAVTIEWGRYPVGESVEDGGAVRLLGAGRDGRFVVAWRTGSGREVAVAIRAGHRAPVFVAARSLAMGAVLEADDVAVAERVRWGGPDRGRSDAPVGMEVRKSVPQGTVLEPPVVAPPVVIQPGQVVRFGWEAGGVRIVREAVAEGQARVGEPIWGREARGQDRIRGIAQGPGRARLIPAGGT